MVSRLLRMLRRANQNTAMAMTIASGMRTGVSTHSRISSRKMIVT